MSVNSPSENSQEQNPRQRKVRSVDLDLDKIGLSALEVLKSGLESGAFYLAKGAIGTDALRSHGPGPLLIGHYAPDGLSINLFPRSLLRALNRGGIGTTRFNKRLLGRAFNSIGFLLETGLDSPAKQVRLPGIKSPVWVWVLDTTKLIANGGGIPNAWFSHEG